jgi:hypothetical protein
MLGGALLAAASGFAAHGQAMVGPQDGWASITACAKHHDREQRRDCVDQVLRRAGLLEELQTAAPGQAETSPSPRPAQGAEAAAPGVGDHGPGFGLPVFSRSGEKVELILSDVREEGGGKLVLITGDGAVWRQANSGDIVADPPRAGQKLVIQRASLGGYLCKVGRWVEFRCYRDR